MALCFTGCGPNNTTGAETQAGNIKVAATIFPVYDIVRQVGGNRAEALLILPPGASPHTFEVTPAQVKAVQGAKILFTVGGEVDAWAAAITNTVAGVEVNELNRSLVLKPFRTDASASSSNHFTLDAPVKGGSTAGLDPHTWLDPDKAAAMAGQIAASLGNIDPANRDYYSANLRTFTDALAAKDREWQAELKNLPTKKLIVFHDAWGYFADHFGLTIAGAFEPFPGKTPSPAYLTGLEATISNDNINTIFVEPQFSASALETLAGDLKVKVSTLDPIGGVSGRDSYIGLIDYDVNNIYEALKP